MVQDAGMTKNVAVLLLAPALVLAGVAGAPRDALARRELAAVRACTAVSADAERLACYDRALGVERTATAGGVESARAVLGGSAPDSHSSTHAARSERRNERPQSADRESADERQTRTSHEKQQQESADVEVTVVQVRRTPRTEEVAFITEDGQVWRQTDDKHVMFPRPPFRAVISPGSLGSHFLTPKGERVDIQVAQQ